MAGSVEREHEKSPQSVKPLPSLSVPSLHLAAVFSAMLLQYAMASAGAPRAASVHARSSQSV